jgi:serine/threonine protein kinase
MRRLPDGYTVVAQLSSNQALDVYDVFSHERGCRCIAKIVRPDRPDARARNRLVREGEILLGATHPHLVRAYELHREPEPVLILETLTGLTLSRLREDHGPLGAGDLAELGAQLCSAVGYLHRRGWLHLDLKPDNVIAERGMAKVLDLSLARPPGPVPAGIGTRQYAAPEQVAGGEAGPAADVWGIGALLHALAAPRLAGVPARLARLLAACLEPRPQDRPAVEELHAALEGHADALDAAA